MADPREAPPPGDCTAIGRLALSLALLVSHRNQPLSSSLLFGLPLPLPLPASAASPAPLHSSPSNRSVLHQSPPAATSASPDAAAPPKLPHLSYLQSFIFTHFARLPPTASPTPSLKIGRLSKRAVTTFLHSPQPLLPPPNALLFFFFFLEIQRG